MPQPQIKDPSQFKKLKSSPNETDYDDPLSLKHPNNEGFTGKFPIEYCSLKDPGELDKPLYSFLNMDNRSLLMPSILLTTSELKVDINFDPVPVEGIREKKATHK